MQMLGELMGLLVVGQWSSPQWWCTNTGVSKLALGAWLMLLHSLWDCSLCTAICSSVCPLVGKLAWAVVGLLLPTLTLCFHTNCGSVDPSSRHNLWASLSGLTWFSMCDLFVNRTTLSHFLVEVHLLPKGDRPLCSVLYQRKCIIFLSSIPLNYLQRCRQNVSLHSERTMCHISWKQMT
jgi:hypothetical protein